MKYDFISIMDRHGRDSFAEFLDSRIPMWVDELRQVLSENVNYAYHFIGEHFKGVTLAKPEGTYMLFLDCSEWCREHNMTIDELEAKEIEVGVIWHCRRVWSKRPLID